MLNVTLETETMHPLILESKERASTVSQSKDPFARLPALTSPSPHIPGNFMSNYDPLPQHAALSSPGRLLERDCRLLQ